MTRRLLAIATVVLALMAGWSGRLARAEGRPVATESQGMHRSHPGRVDRPHSSEQATSPGRAEVAWEADEDDEEGASVSFELMAADAGACFSHAEAALRTRPHADDGLAGSRAPIHAPLRC